jgi:predicted Zn-dependent protease
MPDTASTLDGTALGEWLHGAIVEACEVDTTPWVIEIVERVVERLHPTLPSGARPEILVIFVQAMTAFTAPGGYIYVSRRLLERCPADPAVALLIAHEVAHHELGHLDLFTGVARHLPRVGGAAVVATVYQLLANRLYSPENEAAADRRALERCLAAGYDGRQCLRLLEVLEDDALDHGDLDAVFGPAAATDPDLVHDRFARMWVWASTRLRGYQPLHQRLMKLRHQLGDPAVWPGDG